MFQNLINKLFKRPVKYVAPPNAVFVADEPQVCLPIEWWRVEEGRSQYGFTAELIERAWELRSPNVNVSLGYSPVTNELCFISNYDRKKL
jgi:hypothetical protein